MLGTRLRASARSCRDGACGGVFVRCEDAEENGRGDRENVEKGFLNAKSAKKRERKDREGVCCSSEVGLRSGAACVSRRPEAGVASSSPIMLAAPFCAKAAGCVRMA